MDNTYNQLRYKPSVVTFKPICCECGKIIEDLTIATEREFSTDLKFSPLPTSYISPGHCPHCGVMISEVQFPHMNLSTTSKLNICGTNIKVVRVPGLMDKRKYLIMYDNKPLIFCGENEVGSVITVINNGSISDSIPLSRSKQGKVLKIHKQLKGE